METKRNDKLTPEFLNALILKLRAQYYDDKNITNISWGLGRSKGKLDKGVCIIFSVHQKTDSEKIRSVLKTSIIPDRIEGVPTDVKEMNPRKQADSVGSRDNVIADPLNGGWTTSNADDHTIWFNGWGTLGILCTDNETGDLMALSNWHVWADGGEEGNTIIQPAHPRGGDHVEGVTKVLACGPLIPSLLEWESPEPLALGLYGAAAAAAVAAALSDYRDPSRRGQDATIPAAGEKTVREKIHVDTSYVDLPIPGMPFRTDVKWEYIRETTGKTYTHTVSEEQINAQFLLGKYVTADQQSYAPGEVAHIEASIWDYQPRPCDAYHVIAHLIPDENPTVSYPLILHPAHCKDDMPWYPPNTKNAKKICYDFGQHKPGTTFPYKYSFDWLLCYELSQKDLHIVDWQTAGGGQNKGELAIGQKGLRFSHNPCSSVHITVAAFTSRPVVVNAYDQRGNLIGSVQTQGISAEVSTLDIVGQGIASTMITGGGGEGVLLQYCVGTEMLHDRITELSADVNKRLDTAHVKFKDRKKNHVKANRCCFRGSFRIPPMEPKGRWTVYLTVQNINNVPQGTNPEIAAETIGGHLLAAPTAQLAGCLFVMLGDHVFDIF